MYSCARMQMSGLYLPIEPGHASLSFARMLYDFLLLAEVNNLTLN